MHIPRVVKTEHSGTTSDGNTGGNLPADGAAASSDDAKPIPEKKPKRRSILRILGIGILFLIIAAAIARPFLPWFVKSYVNRTLDRSQFYQGKVGDVTLHLWRGAYSIEDVTLSKVTGNIPVPLFAAKRVDFAIEWNALLHRRIVGQVVMDRPELNFVDAPSAADSQTGSGGPWLQILTDLFPFKINSARVQNGSVHFRSYQTKQPVDVYLSHMNASVDDLTNIQDQVTPLLTTVKSEALAMDQAKFEFQMKLDPFSYEPNFHMAARLLSLDVTKVNNLALAYGAFDFKRGWFDLVIETDAKAGQMTGYVKPLFRNLQVFSLVQDIKEDKPLQFFWTALVGGVAEILKNRPRDQVGTLIPFKGNETGNSPDILATIGNVLRNAFVRAYLPRLQNGSDQIEGLEFGPPSLTDPISVGDQ